MKTTISRLGMLLAIVSMGAQADPIISDIGIEVRNTDYAGVTAGDSVAATYDEFLTGELICDESLEEINNAGSVQSCGGPNTNIATLFTLDITQSIGRVDWQFGADWGNGGVIFASPAAAEDGFAVEGDIWWDYNWGNADVLNFATTVGGSRSFTLNLLGFEGCCGGGMSLRYSTDGGESWQVAAVNAVPEPGTLALLGLGLLGLGVARRRRL